MLAIIEWTATGLIAGWIARRLVDRGRAFGLLGDLVTGWLGGIAGG